MRNIRLTLAYDGTDYVGWQVQSNGVSVQSVVEHAIERLTGTKSPLIAAGRTDSGVHALGQVANFHTECSIPAEKIPIGLQNFLPRDIVVREAIPVDASFHATYSAQSKRYRYVIHNSRVSDPFVRKYAYHYRGRLDVSSMQDAAHVLIGTHDFRSFESHFPNKASSVRTVTDAALGRSHGWSLWDASDSPQRTHDVDGSFVWFEIVADGFLYNMVRAIMGTLLKVGQGKWTAEDVLRILEGQDRSLAGETAPAHGLYLVHVDYPDNEDVGETLSFSASSSQPSTPP